VRLGKLLAKQKNLFFRPRLFKGIVTTANFKQAGVMFLVNVLIAFNWSLLKME